jgi:hypothetical protein
MTTTDIEIDPELELRALLRDPTQGARRLETTAERAFRGDAKAFASYHHALYELHDRDERDTDGTRRAIARTAYRYEERAIPRVEVPVALSEAALVEAIDRQVLSGGRGQHPMIRHLFDDRMTVEEVRLFLRHQWFRTYRLYQDASDLAVNLAYDVEGAALMARYLYQEMGEDDPAGAHVALLANLLRELDVPCEADARSTLLEEMVYLNNRRRSFRSPDVGWAFAIFYVTELVVSASHQHLYRVMRDVGVSERGAEYYRVHIDMVPPRAKREWAFFWRFLQHREMQETFLTSLRHHLGIERRYFDAVWRTMQALPGHGAAHAGGPQ